METIELFVKRFTGKTAFVKVEQNETFGNIIPLLYSKRQTEEGNGNFDLSQYEKAITFLFAGRTLKKQKSLYENGLKHQSTIHEIAKSWVSDFSTLQPDVFEMAEIENWIQTCQKKNIIPNCPKCRELIEDCHFGK